MNNNTTLSECSALEQRSYSKNNNSSDGRDSIVGIDNISEGGRTEEKLLSGMTKSNSSTNQPDRVLFWTIDVVALGRVRTFLLLTILTLIIYGLYSYIQEFFFKVCYDGV